MNHLFPPGYRADLADLEVMASEAMDAAWATAEVDPTRESVLTALSYTADGLTALYNLSMAGGGHKPVDLERFRRHIAELRAGLAQMKESDG